MTDRLPPNALETARKIHILGVAGTAMGTFARMLAARGYDVRGSDVACYPPMSDQLAAASIPITLGYAAANLDWGPDLVIVGNVIRRDNPEALEVVRRALPYGSFPEVFGQGFLPGRRPVVITGTHGKTTTTSLTAVLLRGGGRDPGLFVGGVPRDFGQSFLLGSGAHFVIEGDEYDTAYFDKIPKFLHYRPEVGVITNIEFDHADIYPNVEIIEAEFAKFVALIPAAGRLIVHGGDVRASRVARASSAAVETYGVPGATWTATEVDVGQDRTTFTLCHGSVPVGRLHSPLPGAHNLDNALAALAVALGEGVTFDDAATALAGFQGVKKRQEVKGVERGVTVIDDFAHHPTAVRETVRAIRARYPAARLFCCFEIESNTSRRRAFQDAYPPAFEGATAVLFCRPLEKADNLPPEERIQLSEVVAALRDEGILAELIPEVGDMVAWLAARVQPGDVVLGMSGRHFYGLHQLLLDALRAT